MSDPNPSPNSNFQALIKDDPYYTPEACQERFKGMSQLVIERNTKAFEAEIAEVIDGLKFSTSKTKTTKTKRTISIVPVNLNLNF